MWLTRTWPTKVKLLVPLRSSMRSTLSTRYAARGKENHELRSRKTPRCHAFWDRTQSFRSAFSFKTARWRTWMQFPDVKNCALHISLNKWRGQGLNVVFHFSSCEVSKWKWKTCLQEINSCPKMMRRSEIWCSLPLVESFHQKRVIPMGKNKSNGCCFLRTVEAIIFFILRAMK